MHYSGQNVPFLNGVEQPQNFLTLVFSYELSEEGGLMEKQDLDTDTDMDIYMHARWWD